MNPRRSLVLLGLAVLVMAGPAQASPAPARQPALGLATSSPAAVPTSADVPALRAGTAADRSKKRTPPWAYPVRKGTPISGIFGEIGPYWPTGNPGRSTGMVVCEIRRVRQLSRSTGA